MKNSIIVPTLNEEKSLERFFETIPLEIYEIIVVDGGSNDKTVEIAQDNGARIVVKKGLAEFPSRNLGAKLSQGELLIFTSAKTRFHKDTFQIIDTHFNETSNLIAFSSPAKLLNPPFWGIIEYTIYDHLRVITSKLGLVSTSTNFLCIRRDAFEKTGGFANDVNGDGVMGRQLNKMGKVKFYPKPLVSIKSHRLHTMGFLGFNYQFLYVVENFLPFLEKFDSFKTMKKQLNKKHIEIHKHQIKTKKEIRKMDNKAKVYETNRMLKLRRIRDR